MTSSSIHPFPYDPFQQRAIEVIDRGHSLFVAAPTGSGKTVLADYVIDRTLQRQQRVIYTAPIKALSNQKFRDFTARYGGGRVGILTGDVTIHPTAPLVIMTTEIYRNTLLENPDRLAAYAWVIFDEIHYLDDPERGTVWEEAILFTPEHIKLLALSATIPNVEELAQWIRTVHQRPVEIIEETRRPVPLSLLFQCQNAILSTPQELKRIGYGGQEDWRPRMRNPRVRHHLAVHPNRFEKLIQELQDRDRLPCIVFTFGRRRAEELAWELSGCSLLTQAERAALRAMFDALCVRFQLAHDRSAEALGRLIDRGVGYHHAGMLPTVKEVLERCFASRLMKLIVTTETFALGVNMPARSVVLDTLKKRSDSGFQLLRRREFLQMAGRAGRRGMDEAGFVYLRVNPMHVTYPDVMKLLQAKLEPVHSRFNTTYATLLNLYRRLGPALLSIFPKTLYYAQTSGATRQDGLEMMQRKLELLSTMGYLIPPPSWVASLSPAERDRPTPSPAPSRPGAERLTPKGAFGSWVYGYELLLTELYTQQRLTTLDSTTLGVLMAAVVYEPRPRSHPPKSHQLSKRLAELCKGPLASIHKEELRLRISPKTKVPAYHLTYAMERWMANAPFDRLIKLCDVDEGEIVRYFRMAVQLLRQLAEIPTGDATLRANATYAIRRINRDVIDAEAQLRLG
ncbi:MAG: DEAD/DEAH box helicase [Candidatus Omnitrophica bacterium]|nr:DEAD/DEAH box helicase [Candidatus Omnitrophota bacterium]